MKRMMRNVFSGLLFVTGLFIGANADAATKYVTPNGGATTQDGNSWETAYPGTRLQTTMNEDGTTEVWIAGGTYRIVDQISPNPNHPHFTLAVGIKVYGGFAGTESSLADREIVAGGKPWEFVNETIFLQTQSNAANCRVVHMNNGTSADARTTLNGVTLTGGSIQGTEPGGGINMYEANTLLEYCTVKGNVTRDLGSNGTDKSRGAGIFVNGGIVRYCLITKNRGYEGGWEGAYGGGIYTNGAALIENCEISKNTASKGNNNNVPGSSGAGIYINGAGTVVRNCEIHGNASATIFSTNATTGFNQCGAGIFINATATIENCNIYDNEVGSSGSTNQTGLCGMGGGIFANAAATIKNCRVTGNAAVNGGGIWTNAAGTVIDGCKIAMNRATGANGGGVRTNNVAVTIKNSYICSNRCSTNGGGVGGDAFTLENCVVANNWSAGWGAAMWNPNNSNLPIVINCTVVNNDCPNRGNDIAGGHGPSLLQNTIFWDHRGGVCTNGNWLKNNGTITVNCASNFRTAANMGSATAYIELPAANDDGLKFVAPSDLSLGSEVNTIDPDWESRRWWFYYNSVVINAGATDGAPDSDIRGQARATPPTIGAFEYNANDPYLVISGLVQNSGSVTDVTVQPADANATVTYYASEADAEAGTNAITISELQNPGTYWVRAEVADGNPIYPPCVTYATLNVARERLFVTEAGAGNQDGSNWANAYSAADLQTAMNTVGVKEVWVAQGTYYPTQIFPCGTIMSKLFQVREGLKIYGGFQGNETTLNERQTGANSWNFLHPTIFSGDNDHSGTHTAGDAQHVIQFGITAYTQPSLVNGITIQEGFAGAGGVSGDGEWDKGGGVLMATNCEVSQCIIRNNRGNWACGGIRMWGGTLSECLVEGNIANSEQGGGILVSGPGAVIANCRIGGNTTNSTAGSATAQHAGGGIHIVSAISNTTITNCLVDNNTGVGITAGTGTVIQNCTIVNNKNNSATVTGNVTGAEGGVSTIGASGVIVRNSIVWGNEKKANTSATASTPPLGQIGGNASTMWNNNFTAITAASSINNAFSWAGNNACTLVGSVYLLPGTNGASSGSNDNFGTLSTIPQPFIQPSTSAGAAGYNPNANWGLLPGSACNFVADAATASTTDIFGKTRPATPSIGAVEYDSSMPYLTFSNLVQVEGNVSVSVYPTAANAAVTYYQSEADAISKSNPLAASAIQNVGNYWIRAEVTAVDPYPAVVQYANLSVKSTLPHVTLAGSGDFSGRNWDNATPYTDLPTILSSDLVSEIRVATGTYPISEGYTILAATKFLGGWNPTTNTITSERSRFVATQRTMTIFTLEAGNESGFTTLENVSAESGLRGFIVTGKSRVENCRAFDNTITTGDVWGSAVDVRGGTDNYFNRCVFENNRDNNNARGYIDFTQTTFNAIFTNCIMAHNTSTNNNNIGAFGGTFINCTFVGNRCAISTHGNAPATVVKNCIFWNNGTDISGTTNLTSINNAISGSTDNGNFTINNLDNSAITGPNFTKVVSMTQGNGGYSAENDWTLLPISCLINRGATQIAQDYGMTTDFNSNPRLWNPANGTGGVVDVGAYEFQGKAYRRLDFTVPNAVYNGREQKDVVAIVNSADPRLPMTSLQLALQYSPDPVIDAGTYTVTPIGADDHWTFGDTTTYIIAKAPKTIQVATTATAISTGGSITFTAEDDTVYPAAPTGWTKSGNTYTAATAAAGTYTFSFTYPETTNYTAGNANIVVTVSEKLIPTITAAAAKSAPYSGKAIKADGATVTGSTGAVSYEYRSDLTGWSASAIVPGTYDVRITVAETDTYAGASIIATANLIITPAPLVVEGLFVAHKPYDGSTTANISHWGGLSGVVSGDDVQLSTVGATATYASENVGSAIPVTATGLSIYGKDAYKYTYDGTAQGFGDITPVGTLALVDATVAPTNAEEAIAKAGKAVLSWDENSGINNFLLQYGTDLSFPMTLPVNDTNIAEVSGLLPATHYYFRLSYDDADGNSTYSNVVELTTGYYADVGGHKYPAVMWSHAGEYVINNVRTAATPGEYIYSTEVVEGRDQVLGDGIPWMRNLTAQPSIVTGQTTNVMTAIVNQTTTFAQNLKLDAWIDLNRDGIFDADEHMTIAPESTVLSPDNILSFPVMLGDTIPYGTTLMARFRASNSTSGDVDAYGFTNTDAGQAWDVALFVKAPADVTTFTIALHAGAHGKFVNDTGTEITEMTVNAGSNATIRLLPETGYSVENILIDGAQGTIVHREFTLANIQGDRTITASFTNFPTIFINTEDGSAVTSKEIYKKATVIVDQNVATPAGDDITKTVTGEIKGRGNSTWSWAKKPYRLKYSKANAQNYFGMGTERNYVLLANYIDPSGLRNDLAFEMGRRLGVPFTHNTQHVRMIFNGKYDGLYQMTEQNEVKPNRVDIGADDWLCEFDTYNDELIRYTTQYNMPTKFKQPEASTASYSTLPADEKAAVDRVMAQINAFENALKNSDPSRPDLGYEDHINYETFIDWLIVHMIGGNNEPAHPKSSYFHTNTKTGNGKITGGVLWDFDWAYGYSSGGGVAASDPGKLANAMWFKRLFAYPKFQQKFKERWAEVRTMFENTSGSTVYDYIEEKGAFIADQQTQDYKRWGKTTNYPAEKAHLKTWLASSFNAIQAFADGLTPTSYAITLNPVSNGSATVASPGIVGDSIVITVAPDADYAVSSITLSTGGAVYGSDTTFEFMMPNSAVSVTVNLIAATYPITVTSGTANPTQGRSGTSVTVTANAAAAGRVFSHWTSSPAVTFANANAASTTFGMVNEPVTVTANYGFIPYAITVSGGSANYTEGFIDSVITITANVPTGKRFTHWTVNSGGITLADANAGQTTFTMPANTVSVTANYENINYTVGVTGGSASKTTANYQDNITVTANTPTGMRFVDWTTTPTDLLTDPTVENPVFAMPDTNVTLTAKFEFIPYAITVNSGSANVTTGFIDSVITITADAPARGKRFVKWTVVAGTLAFTDTTATSTTFTMPASAVEVTANYEDIEYSITVNGGTSDASTATYQTSVTVDANPPLGKHFVNWTTTPVDLLTDATQESVTFDMPDTNVTLTATFEFTPYAITVNGGSANYAEGFLDSEITITAAAPATGMRFKNWTIVSGDITLADLDEAQTTFTMPNSAVEVTANYENIEYDITTVNSTASLTTAFYDSVITVTADVITGKTFTGWTSTPAVTFASATDTSTTFNMPAENVEITANYDYTVYTITVNGGTPSQSSAIMGTEITITSDTPVLFKAWTAEGIDISDSAASDPATFAMPAGDVTLTALYYQKIDYERFAFADSIGFCNADTAPEVECAGVDFTVILCDSQVKDDARAIIRLTDPDCRFPDGTTDSEFCFAIAPEKLHFTAISKTIIAGEPMPTFDSHMTGTIYGDIGLNTRLEPNADGKTPGQYPITLQYWWDANSADSFNYTISFTSGTFSVVERTYAVTVEYGTSDSTVAAEGRYVTITADAPAQGWRFANWSSSSLDVVFTDVTAATTSFRMPAEAVTVTANYEVDYPETTLGGEVPVTPGLFGPSVTVLDKKTKLQATYELPFPKKPGLAPKKLTVKISPDGTKLQIKKAVRLVNDKSLKALQKAKSEGGFTLDIINRYGDDVQYKSWLTNVAVKIDKKTLSDSFLITFTPAFFDEISVDSYTDAKGKVAWYLIAKIRNAGSKPVAKIEYGAGTPEYMGKWAAALQKKWTKLPVEITTKANAIGAGVITNDPNDGIFIFKLHKKFVPGTYERFDFVLDNKSGFTAETLPIQ